MAAPLLMREKMIWLKLASTYRLNITHINNVNGQFKNNILRNYSCFQLMRSRQCRLKQEIALTSTRSFGSNFNEGHNQHSKGSRASNFRKGVFIAAASVASVGLIKLMSDGFKVFAQDSERPFYKPSRQVLGPTDTSGLKLTLYQYQSCPFCCKVRATLDYYGFSYDVIEVNSVTKKQLKWSEYQKVPILVINFNDENQTEVRLKDSSVIISILESYRQGPKVSISQLNTYYPCMTEKEGRRVKYNFLNKYFIMFPDNQDFMTQDERSEEMKWRQWADDHLVHMLSPNAYRTWKEALQAFNYFSVVGEWEQNFTTLERYTVIYVGSTVMYVMGKILKVRYSLNDDVRISLYQACNDWVKAVGKDRPFMGGSKPNLADLAVYGVLSSIEGCICFQDVLEHTKIGPWFRRMKEAVQTHQGSSLSKSVTSV